MTKAEDKKAVEALRDAGQRRTIAGLLTTQGFAQVRTGKYRTVAAARKLGRAAAADAGVEIKTSEKASFLLVTVK